MSESIQSATEHLGYFNARRPRQTNAATLPSAPILTPEQLQSFAIIRNQQMSKQSNQDPIVSDLLSNMVTSFDPE